MGVVFGVVGVVAGVVVGVLVAGGVVTAGACVATGFEALFVAPPFVAVLGIIIHSSGAVVALAVGLEGSTRVVI